MPVSCRLDKRYRYPTQTRDVMRPTKRRHPMSGVLHIPFRGPENSEFRSALFRQNRRRVACAMIVALKRTKGAAMCSRHATRILGCALLFLTGLLLAQKPFRQYPGREYDDFPLPPDWREP